MEPVANATIYIVDDDASVREALAWLLRTRRLPSESFDSAEAFEAALASRSPQRQPCCLVLGGRLPRTRNGLSASCAFLPWKGGAFMLTMLLSVRIVRK